MNLGTEIGRVDPLTIVLWMCREGLLQSGPPDNRPQDVSGTTHDVDIDDIDDIDDVDIDDVDIDVET